MIIHYNCSILFHSFLVIYHPYPPSFHEMIFILVCFLFMRALYIYLESNGMIVWVIQGDIQ